MLDRSVVDEVVDRALREDAPWGDITSALLVPSNAQAQAVLTAREPRILAGSQLFEAAFRRIESWTRVEMTVSDGDPFEAGDTLGGVEGNAQTLLRAERVALNLVQRMCGVATTTAEYVAAVAGTGARIIDTRKTTPGLRAIEKYAVRCGGGFNHRFSLSDAIMVKDNHLAAVAKAGHDITEALQSLRERAPHTAHIEVEVDRIDQIESVLKAGIDTILLDNFTPSELREAVRIVDGRAKVEASGGITLETVREFAETGVDLISVGALTHSARSLDLGLDFVDAR